MQEFASSFNKDDEKEVKVVINAYRTDRRGNNVSKAFMQIMKMLTTTNPLKMPWEHWNSKSMVLILEASFGKYGDFSAKSKLCPKAKMIYIIIVCDVVHSMCSTKVMDITASFLLSWFHSIMLCQYGGFDVQFAFDRLRNVVLGRFASLRRNCEGLPSIEQDMDPLQLANKLLDEENMKSLELKLKEKLALR